MRTRSSNFSETSRSLRDGTQDLHRNIKDLIKNKCFFKILRSCEHMRAHVHVRARACAWLLETRINRRGRLSPSMVWILGTELGS